MSKRVILSPENSHYKNVKVCLEISFTPVFGEVDIDGNRVDSHQLDVRCGVSFSGRGECFYGSLGRMKNFFPEVIAALSESDRAKITLLDVWELNYARRGNRKQLDALRRGNVSLHNLAEARAELEKHNLYYQDGVVYGTKVYFESIPKEVIQEILNW